MDMVDVTALAQEAQQAQAADETAVTYIHTLRDDVKQDITDRKDWAERIKKNRELRFKTKCTTKPAYPNAPNVCDPLIDDLIEEVRDQEISLLFSSAVLANFIPVGQDGLQTCKRAERLFDDHLRNFGKTRARLEVVFDHKLVDGMGVAKVLPEVTKDKGEVPHFTAVDPLDVVVPTATREIAQADRVCHILNYTKAEFAKAAGGNGWDVEKAKQISEALKSKGGGLSGASGVSNTGDEAGSGRAGYKSDQLSESHGVITVWEVYSIKDGDRWLSVFSPDYPQWPLMDAPWAYAPIVQSVPGIDPMTGQQVMEPQQQPIPDRGWPFFQFRNEGRSLDYYNTRGVPEIIEMDQKEASAFRTSRLIAADFTGKPFITGEKKPEMFKFRAGEWLGNNDVKFITPPATSMIYQGDYARSKASRRVGSASGSLSSSDSSRDKKTATEVSTMQQQANGASANKIDRAAEPLADLFGMIWHDLAYTARLLGQPPPLVASAEAQGAGDLMEVFGPNYVIGCGMSGRSANTMMQLSQLNTVGEFAAKFPQTMEFVKGYDLASLIWGSINPLWARKVLVDPQQAGQSGGAPIEQRLAALSQIVQNQNGYLQTVAAADLNGDGIPDAQQKLPEGGAQ